MARSSGDPRGTYEYKRNAAAMLAADDTCHLCGHGGARTADHIITVTQWLHLHGTYQGVNDPSNLAPAHGTHRYNLNPCPDCAALGRNPLCNQSRGARPLGPQARSRDW